MSLELATFKVEDVVLGPETNFVGGVLSVNVEKLRARLLEDVSFEDVLIDVVKPGEGARIVHVLDVVEPRVRVSDPGSDFPGVIGPPQTVGSGTTHRLEGVAVVEASDAVPGETTYWREAIVDMSGEGARYSPFSGLINLVLTFKPKLERFHASDEQASPKNLFGGTPKAIEYNLAVRRAGLKAAIYLAEAAKGSSPDRVDVYNLAPVATRDLPRVVYLMQTLPYIYGEIAPGVVGHVEPGVLPTIIHPNEILDGALVNSFNPPACMRETTWMMQNHAVIEDLFERHDKELDFRGVVLYTYGDSTQAKERTTSYAASIAQLLGADGGVLSTLGGGHPSVDAMMLCQELERRRIKTVMLLMEMAANPKDSGFIHYVREADAIVSTGGYEQKIDVPAQKRVLGGSRIFESGEDAGDAMNLTLRHFIGSTSQFGHGHLRGQGY